MKRQCNRNSILVHAIRVNTKVRWRESSSGHSLCKSRIPLRQTTYHCCCVLEREGSITHISSYPTYLRHFCLQVLATSMHECSRDQTAPKALSPRAATRTLRTFPWSSRVISKYSRDARERGRAPSFAVSLSSAGSARSFGDPEVTLQTFRGMSMVSSTCAKAHHRRSFPSVWAAEEGTQTLNFDRPSLVPFSTLGAHADNGMEGMCSVYSTDCNKHADGSHCTTA